MRAVRWECRSHIINIASVLAFKGYAEQSAYAASKHALLGMSKTLAREVADDGIRVHVVHTGVVDTAMRLDADRSTLMQPRAIADVVVTGCPGGAVRRQRRKGLVNRSGP